MKRRTRELISQGVIATAVAVGGWLILVEPKTRELHALEQQIEAAREGRSAFASVTLERITESLREVQVKTIEIEENSRLANDSAYWFERISALTEQFDLTVQGIRPEPPMKAQAGETVTSARIDVQVDGSFESIALFLEALRSGEGYILPSVVELSPVTTGGSQLVHARISLRVLGFEVPSELHLGGQPDE